MPHTFKNEPLTDTEKAKLLEDYLEWDGIGQPNETVWEWENKQDQVECIPAVFNYVMYNAYNYPGKEQSVLDYFAKLNGITFGGVEYKDGDYEFSLENLPKYLDTKKYKTLFTTLYNYAYVSDSYINAKWQTKQYAKSLQVKAEKRLKKI